MPPIKHALLGASKAHQWLECPPSVRWEQKFTEPPSSEAAAEGTLAHAIAEEHLRRILAGKKVATSKKLKDDPLYRPAMEEYVDVYVDYVMAEYTRAQQTTKDALLLMEERVDFTNYVPEGFGTADCVLIADKVMHVFDLKYGKGIPVDAVGNPQIRLYALGVLDSYDMLYDIRQVKMHIIQPRLDSITSETMSAEDLHQWGVTKVKPQAALAFKGEGEFKAGEHCRWCLCRNTCRAYAELRLSVAQYRFAEDEHERLPNELAPEEITDILERVDDLTRWAKSIKEWAQDQAINHNMVFPGWKVVEGRANRVITDEAVAIDRLDSAGFTQDSVTKLKGITDLEELVGKKRLAEILDGLLVKPQGKPVLVPESDKRPPINSALEAQKVFKEE